MRVLFLFLLLVSGISHSQSWDWVQTIGLGGNNVVWDLTRDSQNNIITTGRVKFQVRFGLAPAGILSNSLGPQTDAYLFKVTEFGDTLWAVRMGGVDPDWSRGVVTDQYDNIYVTGDFCNMAVFETDTIYGYNNGSTDPLGNGLARSGFIAKYDPDGNLIWVNKFQGGDQCRSYSIDVDANGNSYITGMISGLTQFDSNITGEANAIVYGFIAKYNSNGICVWASYIDSPYGSMGNDLKIINDETIVITGYYKGSMVYDGHTFPGGSTSWGNFYLLQVDSSGSFNWNKTGTGTHTIAGNDIAVDASQNIYVVGHFAPAINFGSASLTAIGTGTTTAEINANQDCFLVKYNVNGNLIWVNQIGNNSLTEFEAVDVWEDSKVVIAGYTSDTIFFSNPADSIICLNNYASTVVISYDTSGVYQWNMQVDASGTNGDNAPQSLAFDSHGNLFCGGWYDMFGTWGATTIEADNGYDAYIAKIFPPLEPSIEGDTLICLGDTVIFTGERFGYPFTYNWESNTGTIISSYSDTLIWLGSTEGFDTVRYIVSNGYQTDTAFFTIQIASLPNTSLGNDVVMCDGDSVVLDAGGLGELFDWGGGFVVNDSAQVIYDAGTISVIVQNAEGCISFDSITVSLTSALFVDLGPDQILCDGDSLILDAGGNGFNYNWGFGQVMNDSAYTVYSGGTYVVEVSDLFGCSGTDTIEINGSNCLSIFEMDQSGIIVSPNPFFETITFQTQNTDDQQVLQISLYSMSGKLVYSASNVKLNQPIELASLENGIYICEVKSEQHTVDIVKIIKID